MVLGPPLNPKGTTSESMTVLTQMGDGSFKRGAPRFCIGLVDVRDVADAHFKAGYTPQAKGRYITFGHSTDFYEMAKSVLPKYGNLLPLPKSVAPKWLIWLIGPFINKALSRKYINNNVNIEWKADNSKIINELGMDFRSIRETMEDSMEVLIEEGILGNK
jgi:nucleoside-diphosphate-sugar epimerase